MAGTLTFLNAIDAQTFWAKLETVVLPTQILYAKLDLTSNSHHWSDDRVERDVIIDQIILGDPNAVPFP